MSTKSLTMKSMLVGAALAGLVAGTTTAAQASVAGAGTKVVGDAGGGVVTTATLAKHHGCRRYCRRGCRRSCRYSCRIIIVIG